MAKKFKMLSFVQICGVQSFRVAANSLIVEITPNDNRNKINNF